MKICMYSIDEVFSRSTGGIRRFLELYYALSEAGHDVFFYSADSSEALKKNKIKGLSIRKNNDISGHSMVGLKAAFSNKELFSAIKKEKFDRVIVFDVRAAFSLVVNRIDNIYLFLRQDMLLYKKIQLDDSNTGRLKKSVLLKVAECTEAMCLRKAKKIIVQCQFDLDGLYRRHPLMKGRIEKKSVIQINNINPSWIRNDNSQASDKIYDLIFIGNFKDNRKGHDLLLPALKELSDEGIKIKTAVIGDGKQLEYWKNECRDTKSIEFLGRIENPLPILRASRLMIVPSYVDSCPNTVMEGLYYHIPVIGSNRSGIPEILNDDRWLFEMSISAVKQSLIKALEPENLSSLLSEQSVRRKELMFDWGKKMVDIVES